MPLFRRLASALLLRKVSRDLADISASLRAHTVLLQRLADHYAPLDATTTRPEVQQGTGVSTFDPVDAVLAEEYIARTYQDTGHIPDDDEVLIYLADEKTHDLHQRLASRESELTRLRESREW